MVDRCFSSRLRSPSVRPVRVPRAARPPLADAALALALLVLGLLNLAHGLDSFDPGVSKLLDAALLPLSTLPLAWRRTAPGPVFVVVAGSVLLPDLFVRTGFTSLGEGLALFLALYTVAAHASLRYALLALAVSQAEFLVLAARRADFEGVGAYLFWVALTAGPWAAGLANVALRRRNRDLQALAVQHARLAQRAVFEERARISRELHDVISHHVTLMVVQAAVAEKLLDGDPGRARAALGHVARAGGDAMAELELLLQVLRDEPDDQPSEDGEPAARPSLLRLGELTDRFRAAGLAVECTVDGEPRRLPPAVDAAAYRILQEALTNVLRHAGGARARLRVSYGVRALELDVVDDGRAGPAPARPGAAGLLGMRERALLHGGSFEAGRIDGGGFRVRVALPLPVDVAPPARASSAGQAPSTVETPFVIVARDEGAP